ncbi:MAG: hypothetical protein II625_08420, partial [Bacilli bacterium]|nr:hypothetical protein [Bacilli bacterium]
RIVTDKYPSNTNGVFDKNPITVTYYYEKGNKQPDIVINNNNNNDIKVNVTDSNIRETVVVIGDDSPNEQPVVNTNNSTIRNVVTTNPTPSRPTVTSNTNEVVITPNNTTSQTTSIVYDVPNTEKNSYYHIGAILLIATGWYIIVRSKQDEK